MHVLPTLCNPSKYRVTMMASFMLAQLQHTFVPQGLVLLILLCGCDFYIGFYGRHICDITCSHSIAWCYAVPYTTKFSLGKNFAKPSYLCIAEIFGGINFHQCGKGRHILNVIINTGQKIRTIKISPIRADGEIGENFLLAKISVYTV